MRRSPGCRRSGGQEQEEREGDETSDRGGIERGDDRHGRRLIGGIDRRRDPSSEATREMEVVNGGRVSTLYR